jgi:hypothetical protein
MSTLLEQASLVMIPSGYKEDVVYSQIPTNGNGDLSFTRASNGTRINSAGLVEVTPWNLVQYSEQFDNAYWVKTNTTVVANSAISPNGTTTAELVYPTTTGSNRLLEKSFTISTNTEYTGTWYLKASGLSWVAVDHIDGNVGAWFNLSTGTIGTISSGSTASIESVGNGWYRCRVSKTSTGSTTGYHDIRLVDGDNVISVTANGTNGVLVWGAQLNIGSTAKPYFPTTDRLNVPRLTYQNGGGGCPSLLLEKQSTNLQTYSQDFTNVAWTVLGQGVGDTAVVTANYAISPDGTQNATRFVCNLNGGTTSSDRSWMIANFTAQATSTISIWIKLNSAGTKTVLLSDSGGGTKTISGTDWQRIDATFVGAGGEFRIGLIGGSTSDTLDCCIWGAQAEAGTYPTSYIPTTSSSATRVADVCSKTGISSLIGQTEGVLFVDINRTQKSENFNVPISIGLGVNVVQLYFTSTNVLIGQVYTSAGQQVAITSSALANGRYKIALAYASNDFAMYINGTQIGTDSSGTVPTCSQLYIGNDDTGTSSFNDSINQAILFPTRLTNAELASLTTL